ncbi:MAG: class A sortase [Streptococcaceae bacterium]|jgi:sortase A|nr:class A sortase [Streptococcaceae bacterium]
MARKTDVPKKKKSKLSTFLLLLILLIGLALIFNKEIRYFLMGLNSERYSRKISVKKLYDNNKSKQPFDFDVINPVSTEAVLAAQFSTQPLPVIGFIAMPDVKMKLPIFKGLSNTALLYGAGTMKEGQVMGEGNYALASHRVENPNLLFSPIQRAQNEMMIYITNLNQIWAYETKEVIRVTPDHVEVIDDISDQKLITLVTCNDPDAIKRVIVHGDFSKVYDFKNAPKAILDAFDINDTQVDWKNNPWGK